LLRKPVAGVVAPRWLSQNEWLSVLPGSHFVAYCPQPRLAPVLSAKAKTGAGACKMGFRPQPIVAQTVDEAQ